MEKTKWLANEEIYLDSQAAIVAVSVAASVSGALLFLVAWNEGHHWRLRRVAAKALARAQARAGELAVQLAEAEKEVAVSVEQLKQVEAIATAAADRRRAELALLLEQEAARQIQGRSSVEATTRRLRAVAAQ